MHLRIIGADHQLHLLHAARPQPVFGRRHDGAAIALETRVGIHRDVIDPAAMAIVARHDRCDQRTGGVAAEQHGRIVALAGARNVGGGIVPWPRRAAALPKRNDFGNIGVLDRRDCQRRSKRGVHNTFPGFMMPSGSSMALMARISSIATLSFTSGSSSRLSTPMPCSAEIEPPIFSTMSKTTALTSCQRARKSAGSAPTGWLTL